MKFSHIWSHYARLPYAHPRDVSMYVGTFLMYVLPNEHYSMYTDGELKKNGPIPASFCLFSLFSRNNFINTNWKKRRWSAWESNPGPQNGRRRRNHGAMAATRTPMESLGWMNDHHQLPGWSRFKPWRRPGYFCFDRKTYLYAIGWGEVPWAMVAPVKATVRVGIYLKTNELMVTVSHR